MQTAEGQFLSALAPVDGETPSAARTGKNSNVSLSYVFLQTLALPPSLAPAPQLHTLNPDFPAHKV